jgi:hypothetical protein
MTCGGCTGEANVKLCPSCRDVLIQDLAETDSIIGDLRTTMARQDKGADSIGGGGPSGSRPPINLDALDRYEQLREVLTGWATQLEGRAYLVLVRTEDVASYLLANIEKVRTAEWAYDLLDELRDAMNAARMATDRAADRISLGMCGEAVEGIVCTDTVTAITGAAYGRCRTCGTSINVKAYQLTRISAAWHVRGNLPEILRALKAHGSVNIPLERAKKWVQRGKLIPGVDGKFSPAEILDHHRATKQGQAELAA